MRRAVWIVNKYIQYNDYEKYFINFLSELQNSITKEGIELHYLFFSDNLKKHILVPNTHFFSDSLFSTKKYDNILQAGLEIEKEYQFTFKQAYFSDLIQTPENNNLRTIDVDEGKFNDNLHLVRHFQFLENFIKTKSIDIIFSDVSPEAEMEFGRAIGYKLNKLVLKDYEGGFLGRSVFLKLSKFGKDEVVEAKIGLSLNNNEAEKFIDDFIKKKLQPYNYPIFNIVHYTFIKKVLNNIKHLNFKKIVSLPIRLMNGLYYSIEHNIIKKIYLDKYEKNTPYLFFGLHLNQESTMVLRSQPYVNQFVLLEMISRVLPLGYVLYVREHPHWSKTFPLNYLLKIKKLNNVKLISTKISIHEIIKNSKGLLTYNATTGIEALIYGKPVLSFASNVYFKLHSGVDYCSDLFDLGASLTSLINRSVKRKDTVEYIKKMHETSYDIWLSSYLFYSETDAKYKAEKFSVYLSKAIDYYF